MNENTYKICLRLTLQERAKLEADAKLCGLTKSALLRRMISGLEVKARPRFRIEERRGNMETEKPASCGKDTLDQEKEKM